MAASWQEAFEGRDDLNEFGDNALGLFALGLKFGIEDLVSIGADSITDGSDDKKCDLIYIDKEEGVAVVCQCYKASNSSKTQAPANKASDLNTAIGWLLQRQIEDLPDKIKSSAIEIREAIAQKQIKQIYVWYIHNLPESANVETELKTVEESGNAAIERHFSGLGVKVHALEVGTDTLNVWYEETLSPILVNDEFSIDIEEGFRIAGPEWEAFVTSIEARFLYRQYKKHKIALFSANVRDYMGSRSSDSNINNGIKKTADHSPENFWVFNNGITALVHDFKIQKIKEKTKLVITGLSIVNGAQTTGAIGSLSKTPDDSVRVPIRFIKTNSNSIVLDIIQFNNSQNKVTASDFRSTDKIQKRLKDEVSKLPKAEYEGGRRGGFGDIIKRRPHLIPSYTAGQSIAAVHGDPVIAYNQKQDIWIEDTLYSKYFNEHTSGKHIVFCYSLIRAIEQKKIDLVEKSKKDSAALTQDESEQIQFLRKRGAIFLFASALSACIETFTASKISNLFRLSFSDKTSVEDAKKFWLEIIDVCLPLANQLSDGLNGGLKNTKVVNEVITRFKGLISATAKANNAIYKEFATKVSNK